MVAETAQSLRGIHGPDGFAGEQHFAAGLMDPVTELVIVSQKVGERFVTADFAEPGFCGGYGGAESEGYAFFPIGNQSAGEEIAGGTYRFELRAEIFFRNAAVKTTDYTNRWVDEERDNFLKIIWADADVPIALHQEGISGFAGQQGEVVDFAVGADDGCVRENSDAALGKRLHEIADERDSGIREIVHAKKNFVVLVVLRAEAGKIFARGEIYAADRLEKADWRSEISNNAFGLAANEANGGGDGDEIKGQWRECDEQD